MKKNRCIVCKMSISIPIFNKQDWYFHFSFVFFPFYIAFRHWFNWESIFTFHFYKRSVFHFRRSSAKWKRDFSGQPEQRGKIRTIVMTHCNCMGFCTLLVFTDSRADTLAATSLVLSHVLLLFFLILLTASTRFAGFRQCYFRRYFFLCFFPY